MHARHLAQHGNQNGENHGRSCRAHPFHNMQSEAFPRASCPPPEELPCCKAHDQNATGASSLVNATSRKSFPPHPFNIATYRRHYELRAQFLTPWSIEVQAQAIDAHKTFPLECCLDMTLHRNGISYPILAARFLHEDIRILNGPVPLFAGSLKHNAHQNIAQHQDRRDRNDPQTAWSQHYLSRIRRKPARNVSSSCIQVGRGGFIDDCGTSGGGRQLRQAGLCVGVIEAKQHNCCNGQKRPRMGPVLHGPRLGHGWCASEEFGWS
mmetsp:Transcript_8954/g.24438  ORF Transcript_8954/g.24438 Transcript_8954/m.24438 type:complete len:266 (+) Transcript_8954:1128-1925(+)